MARRILAAPPAQPLIRMDMGTIKGVEKQMIMEKLAAYHGNQRKTAMELGIPKSTLHDRLRSYQIDPKQFMRPFQRPSTAGI
jgi:DNA-binding NtrC family response regulator